MWSYFKISIFCIIYLHIFVYIFVLHSFDYYRCICIEVFFRLWDHMRPLRNIYKENQVHCWRLFVCCTKRFIRLCSFLTYKNIFLKKSSPIMCACYTLSYFKIIIIINVIVFWSVYSLFIHLNTLFNSHSHLF